ncbi:MAG TPA: hypothetical protein VF725_02805, partial [Ktedonobacterales bacterium]
MASQLEDDSRLSRIAHGSSVWVSVVVILLYAALCVTATTIYAYQFTPPSRIRLIITLVWGLANTLGGLLLAMTVYGWAEVILRRRRQVALTGRIVSGDKSLARTLARSAGHRDLAPLVARTTLLVASGILLAAAVAPQLALDIYNQPPPTHSVPLGAALIVAQSVIASPATPAVTPAVTPTAEPASSLALPVMRSAFPSAGLRCGDVATDFEWTLTNTATTQAGKPAARTIHWVAFVGDARFTVSPSSGQLAPRQSVTVHVRGPALPAGNSLYLSLYVTDAALDYTDSTSAVACAQR